MQKKILSHRHFNTKSFQYEAILKTLIREKHRMLVWLVRNASDGWSVAMHFVRILKDYCRNT